MVNQERFWDRKVHTHLGWGTIINLHMTHNPTGQTLPDILEHGLEVVFCGINPGVQAAAAGHHFLGRGNRFWPVLHLAGFTPRALSPEEDRTVLAHGLGLTTAVARATSSADELRREEFLDARASLTHKLELYQPRWIAFLGKAAYAGISGRQDVDWGEQPGRIGPTRVWILPNPSGLNRSFQTARLVDAYTAFRRATLKQQ